MNPVAALEAFDRAVEIGDKDGIIEHADALIQWLEGGGFRPVGPNGCDWRGHLSNNHLASVFRMAKRIAEIGEPDPLMEDEGEAEIREQFPLFNSKGEPYSQAELEMFARLRQLPKDTE